jgi:hypothetical protein
MHSDAAAPIDRAIDEEMPNRLNASRIAARVRSPGPSGHVVSPILGLSVRQGRRQLSLQRHSQLTDPQRLCRVGPGNFTPSRSQIRT